MASSKEHEPHGAHQTKKATASGWIGSALEYYDFFIYATAASLVFPQLFFPKGDPTVAIVASLATYGVGYVARPIGAFFLGHWGDTHGRKTVLIVCMFLMGISTMAVGVLPTYHQVGILADSLTGGDRATAALKELAPKLKLGVHRLAIRREPHPADIAASMQFLRFAKSLKLDVLHGHGAKAGAFVRLRGKSKKSIRVYTPHGGSLHYPLSTLKGQGYSRIERGIHQRKLNNRHNTCTRCRHHRRGGNKY